MVKLAMALSDHPNANQAASDGSLYPRPSGRTGHAQGLGLRLGVAGTLEEVIEAWRLVYASYRYCGLISPNRHRIHTSPAALSPRTAVVIGSIDALIVTTITALIDPVDDPGRNGCGLPLDTVYRAELDALRRQDRRLMELGLFADRRLQLARTAETLFQLTRYAFHYGRHQKVTDVVIGVPQRNASFYARWFGFTAWGDPRLYTAIRGQPIVLLRRDMTAENPMGESPARSEALTEAPPPAEVFEKRFSFDPRHIAGSCLERFVNEALQDQRLGQTA